jgi:hypothetical protein
VQQAHLQHLIGDQSADAKLVSHPPEVLLQTPEKEESLERLAPTGVKLGKRFLVWLCSITLVSHRLWLRGLTRSVARRVWAE